MIFTNLAGTTSKRFSVANDGKGQIVSNNAYDVCGVSRMERLVKRITLSFI